MSVAVLGTLTGCMGCMVCVESLAKEQPSAMNLMTFATFLFISLEGLFVTSRLLTVKNRIPIKGYIPVVLTFFLCNVINNQALNFHVPVPLHIIFRSLPSRHDITAEVPMKAANCMKDLRFFVKGQQISLTLDEFSHKEHSLLCVTGSYLTESFEYRSKVLAVESFLEKHTGDNIAVKINSILAELEINKKDVVAATRDGALNLAGPKTGGCVKANIKRSVIGFMLSGRSYSTKKYLSVLAITIGIIICTLATSLLEKKTEETFTLDEAQKHYHEWMIGIAMLTVALLVSSYLAICQERMYTSYGKHPREAMFYIHSISLPFFVFMGPDILKSAIEFTQAPPLQVFGYSVLGWLGVSHLWVKLLGACVMQWLCILFVYRLNSEVDSLTVTLVVTLRKFLSLVVSIVWFQNPFTWLHWIGAALVFGGTLVFSDVISVTKKDTKKIQ